MFKKILIFISVVLFLSSFAQISNNNLKLIHNLSRFDYAEGGYVGVGGDESKISAEFKKIKGKFSNEELLFLARNGSNALRFYSSMELVNRSEPLVVALYDNYRAYPLKMFYLNGCEGGAVDMAEMIFNAFDSKIVIKSEFERLLIEAKQSNSKDLISTYQSEIDKINSILKPDFFDAFERIKKIDEKAKTVKQYYPEYHLPRYR